MIMVKLLETRMIYCLATKRYLADLHCKPTIMSAALRLPQPPYTGIDDSTSATNAQYKYVPYDIFETDWLGKPQLLQTQTSPSNHKNSNDRYAPGTLVWVLLSKGKPKQPKATNIRSTNNIGYNAQALHKKRRNKKNKRKQSNIDDDGKETEDDTNVKKDDDNDTDNNLQEETTTLNHSRKEFFLRARVISDDEEVIPRTGEDNTQTSLSAAISTKQKYDERRVLVRYSKGSTYHVKAYNLIPILEPSMQSSSSTAQGIPPLVVVVPETNIYRRVAKVLTTPNDSFMEIGCDYGITCDKIYNSLLDGEVPRVWPPPKNKEEETDDTEEKDKNDSKESENRVSCLGIDKSTNSIKVANERYPKCKFALGDVLIPKEMAAIRTLCETSLINSAPSIVCIDVNGNREIQGVIDCISSIMNEQWKSLPRMIIVKSRFLYWELKKEEGHGS